MYTWGTPAAEQVRLLISKLFDYHLEEAEKAYSRHRKESLRKIMFVGCTLKLAATLLLESRRIATIPGTLTRHLIFAATESNV